MATKTIKISSFPKGYYMSWTVTTQAAFAVTVKLFDETKVYFEKTKQSMDINPPLAQGADFVNGTNLQVKIDIPQSAVIKNIINSYNMVNSDGVVIGYGYTIGIEDQTDEDYNDACILLVAWKRKG